MLSAVILTKNEEQNIKECITQLSFCDDIVVVDDNSADKTVQIAKSLNASVYTHDLNKNYADQCNFALGKVKNSWALFVDADERVSEKLAKEIKSSLQTDFVAFRIRRHDFMWGKFLTHGEVGAFKSIRLVKKGSGKWMRRVHQYFDAVGDVGELENPLLHYPHKTLRDFVVSINRWSQWHATANYEEGKKSTIFKIIGYPIGHFLKNYLFYLGFLDGIRGFVFAVLMSFHSFLSWSTLFLIQKKEHQSSEDFTV